VIHEDCVAAPLGDGPLGRVVGVVDVQVGDGSDADVRVAVPGQADAFSWQELEVAMSAYMD